MVTTGDDDDDCYIIVDDDIPYSVTVTFDLTDIR